MLDAGDPFGTGTSIPFNRSQFDNGPNTISPGGPTGIPGDTTSLGSGWDVDNSYGDWYMGHEVGHTLGRAHPLPGVAPQGPFFAVTHRGRRVYEGAARQRRTLMPAPRRATTAGRASSSQKRKGGEQGS